MVYRLGGELSGALEARLSELRCLSRTCRCVLFDGHGARKRGGADLVVVPRTAVCRRRAQ